MKVRTMKNFFPSLYSFEPNCNFLNVSSSSFKALGKYHVKVFGPLAIPQVEHTI